MQTLTLENGTTIKVTDEQLQELIDSQEIEHRIGWKPQLLDYFYFISNNLDIKERRYEGFSEDRDLVVVGNCYATKEAAKQAREKQKALRRIHEYMYKNDLVYVPDWSDSIGKYQISGWSYNDNSPIVHSFFHENLSRGNLVFKTDEDRQQVLDNCKEDLEIYLKD